MSGQKCIGCDTPIPYGASQCPMCGAPVQVVQPPESPPSQQTQQRTKTPRNICKYCLMPVPANTVVCPYCRKKIGMTLARKAIAVFFILMVGSCIIQNAKKSDTSSYPPAVPVKPAKTPEEIENEREAKQQDGAKMLCKTLVESSLKAPSTAKWPYYGDFQFAHITGDEPNVYGVIGYVDAQNSFGAMLRNNFICKFKRVGKNYEFIEVVNE